MIKRLLWPLILILIPLLVLTAWYLNRPFTRVLLEEKASLHSLTAIQKHNIALAARRLDGAIIEPGQSFSFNAVVGPRSSRRGYQAAPSYIADDSPKTLGGGICLLSSTLYQLALKSGLKITQRIPHLRPIKTVEPGLDAAIWYGQADVSFQNTLTQPVRLNVAIQKDSLRLTFFGKHKIRPATLQREAKTYPYDLYVTVLRRTPSNRPTGSITERISSDHYRLSRK